MNMLINASELPKTSLTEIPTANMPSSRIKRDRQLILKDYLFRRKVGRQYGHRVMSPEELDIFFHYVLAAKNLSEALQRMRCFYRMLSERFVKGYIRIDETGDLVSISMRFAWDYGSDRTLQTSDVIHVVNWFNFLRWATDTDIAITAIHIPFHLSRAQQRIIHRFCDNVQLGSDCFRIDFSQAYLPYAIVKSVSDIVEFRSLVDYYVTFGFVSSGDMRQYVKKIVTSALSLGDPSPSLADVSKMLNLSSSTLKRRLSVAGYSYREIVNDCKLEFSCRLLGDARHSIEAVADILGYQDHNAFRRAFKAWTGVPPATWRRSVGLKTV